MREASGRTRAFVVELRTSHTLCRPAAFLRTLDVALAAPSSLASRPEPPRRPEPPGPFAVFTGDELWILISRIDRHREGRFHRTDRRHRSPLWRQEVPSLRPSRRSHRSCGGNHVLTGTATPRVTYTTTVVDDESLHQEFELALASERASLGNEGGPVIGGEARVESADMEETSPIDRNILLGRFRRANAQDVADAVALGATAFDSWRRRPWTERVAILRRVAAVIVRERFELAALIALEVGKPRLEALGDVDETAVLIELYCAQLEQNDGFLLTMNGSAKEHAVSELVPYGVWGVIAPFNFPLALGAGPAAAALISGNTVVFKPSHHGFLTGLRLHRAMIEGGVPVEAFQIVTGDDATGAALVAHDRLAGITFTGSYAAGSAIKRSVGERPRAFPLICEMGGKNPTIVSRRAHLERAAEGVARAAFGFSGQKCSACSRVYVEEPVYRDFVDLLEEVTQKLKVGDPLERSTFTGPVVDEEAVRRFEVAVDEASRVGRLLVGGQRLTDGNLSRGNYVQLTVVEAPHDARIMNHELFVPFVGLHRVASFDEALWLANDTPFGLTAGLFSEDQAEIARFLTEIEAGVAYVNRRAGSTTGAWPGTQTFSGWKASGGTGRGTGGHYYVEQYLREKSCTVMRD